MPGGKLKIVVSLPTEDSDYHKSEAQAAKAAGQELGFQVDIIYAEGDAITQSQQLLSRIHTAPDRRPDFIMLEPVGTGMVRVAEEAVKANIGWIVMNRDVDYLAQLRTAATVPAFAVATDHAETGRIQGQQINSLIEGEGVVLYLQGPKFSPIAQIRADGMREVKSAEIQIRALNGNWLESTACSAVDSWLRLPTSRDLNVKLVAAQNDFMAMGARKAFSDLAREYGRADWLNIKYLGCDGLSVYGQKWVSSGLLTGTILCPPLSSLAMKLLARELKHGERAPELTHTNPVSFPAVSHLNAA